MHTGSISLFLYTNYAKLFRVCIHFSYRLCLKECNMVCHSELRRALSRTLRARKPKPKRDACTWRIISVSNWLATAMYRPFGPFGRGTTGYFGDLRSPWLLTTY